MAMMGGMSVWVGVSDGVGGMGVKVGRGLRVEIEVAVRRGGWLAMGASVAVGITTRSGVAGTGAHALNMNNTRGASKFNFGMRLGLPAERNTSSRERGHPP